MCQVLQLAKVRPQPDLIVLGLLAALPPPLTRAEFAMEHNSGKRALADTDRARLPPTAIVCHILRVHPVEATFHRHAFQFFTSAQHLSSSV